MAIKNGEGLSKLFKNTNMKILYKTDNNIFYKIKQKV